MGTEIWYEAGGCGKVGCQSSSRRRVRRARALTLLLEQRLLLERLLSNGVLKRVGDIDVLEVVDESKLGDNLADADVGLHSLLEESLSLWRQVVVDELVEVRVLAHDADETCAGKAREGAAVEEVEEVLGVDGRATVDGADDVDVGRV